MDQLLGHEMKTEYRKGYAAGYGDTVQDISEHWAACECGGIQGAVWRAMRLGGVHVRTKGAIEIVYVLSWYIRQQPKILNRFDPAQNDAHTREGLEYWRDKFDMYLSRAEQLTFESPQGRQAAFEFAATALGLCASVWRLYGPPASIEQDFRKGLIGSEAAKKP